MSLSFDLENTRVILIGSSQFDDPSLPTIPAVRNNVNDLAELFNDDSIIGVPLQNIYTLLDIEHVNVIGLNIAAVVKNCFDTLIIYYAGHGKISNAGELMLTLKGTHSDVLDLTAIPFRSFRGLIQGCPARKKIVIIDCCFSGRAVNYMSTENDLLHTATIEGTYLITSVSGSSLAKASDKDNTYTAFTSAIINTLKNGISENKKVITINDLYRSIKTDDTIFNEPRRSVQQNIDDFQFAYNKAYLEDGDFDFQDGTLVSNRHTTISRVPMELLKHIESKNGTHAQRFVLIYSQYLDYLGVKDGDWVEFEVQTGSVVRKEFIVVFGKPTNNYSFKMSLVTRNLLRITTPNTQAESKSFFDLTNTKVTVRKANLQPLTMWEVSSHDYIAGLPITPEIQYSGFVPYIIAIRSLEFDLLCLTAFDNVSVECYNEFDEKFEYEMKATRLTNSPGRAVIGIEKNLLDEVFKLKQPFYIKISK